MNKKTGARPRPLINWKNIVVLSAIVVFILISHLVLLFVKKEDQYILRMYLDDVFIAYTCILMVVILYIVFSRRWMRRKWASRLRRYNEYKLSVWETNQVDRFYYNANYDLNSIEYATLRLNILLAIIITPGFIYSFSCLIIYNTISL